LRAQKGIYLRDKSFFNLIALQLDGQKNTASEEEYF
jgi:hypothetical protein